MLAQIIQKIKIKIMGPIKYARSQGVTVGDDCRFIAYPNFGSEPYLIKIGNHVNICGNVYFISHDGGTWVFRDKPEYKKVIKYGAIEIGNNCFIGMGTTIMPGVKIGDNCVVGACSLVTKDVKSGTIVGGVPAKYIGQVSDYERKCLENTPEYDVEKYRKNKKKTLIDLYMNGE